MKLLESFSQILFRFRYPFSSPRDIGGDLGIPLPGNLEFNEFLTYLLHPSQQSTRLIRFMPRKEAESMFQSAIRKECFKLNSLFSYYFNGGWVEFMLQFDAESRLRRLYIRHKQLKHLHEIKISSYK